MNERTLYTLTCVLLRTVEHLNFKGQSWEEFTGTSQILSIVNSPTIYLNLVYIKPDQISTHWIDDVIGLIVGCIGKLCRDTKGQSLLTLSSIIHHTPTNIF